MKFFWLLIVMLSHICFAGNGDHASGNGGRAVDGRAAGFNEALENCISALERRTVLDSRFSSFNDFIKNPGLKSNLGDMRVFTTLPQKRYGETGIYFSLAHGMFFLPLGYVGRQTVVVSVPEGKPLYLNVEVWPTEAGRFHINIEYSNILDRVTALRHRVAERSYLDHDRKEATKDLKELVDEYVKAPRIIAEPIPLAEKGHLFETAKPLLASMMDAAEEQFAGPNYSLEDGTVSILGGYTGGVTVRDGDFGRYIPIHREGILRQSYTVPEVIDTLQKCESVFGPQDATRTRLIEALKLHAAGSENNKRLVEKYVAELSR